MRPGQGVFSQLARSSGYENSTIPTFGGALLQRCWIPLVGVWLLTASAPHVHAAEYATTEAFRRFMVSHSDWLLSQDPSFASAMGDRRWNSQWPDTSPRAHAARVKRHEQVQKSLQGFLPGKLSPEDRLHHAMLKRQSDIWLAGARIGLHHEAVNAQEGPHVDFALADLLRFETERDYQDWLARLKNFSQRVEHSISGLEVARARKHLLARRSAQSVAQQLQAQRAAVGINSPFYAPFRKFPTDMPPATQNRLRQDALSTLEKIVTPALKRFEQYWLKVYLPATAARDGLSSHPAGPRLYAHLLAVHCSVPVPAPVVHARAQKEVAELRAQLETLQAEVGFTGTLSEFLLATQADARFAHPSRAAALAEYELLVRRLQACLPNLFHHTQLPPCGVAAVPDAVAPGAPAGYYLPATVDGARGGTFFVNLGDLARRPAYEAAPLALHEAIPGHHLQFSRQFQEPTWPAFRRLTRYSAFVEGWGLYAESLGEPLGLYRDPYARFGRLMLNLRRAVRVVLDTGLHAGHWRRAEAKAYYQAQCPRSESDIENDLDRIQADPGQATAYKVGEWKILELQARASEALGPRYDLRDFHEALLKEGVIPLDLLETRFDAWLKAMGGTIPRPQTP